MTTRKYSSRSQQTTLSAALTSSATQVPVVSASVLLGGVTINAGEVFTVVIDPDTALEEIIDVSSILSNTLTVTRGVDGSTGQAHSAGAVVRHMAIGRDYRESNLHIENTTSAHGLTIANVLETTDTNMITTAMLQSNAVTTAKITDLNVTTAKLADSAVTTAKITDSNVTTGKIADLNVTTGKIADSAITSAKIADLTIATGDIADSAITSAKIADGTIVAGDIADGAVTSAKILDGTIVNADINSAAAIDKTKISGTAITAADTGTITSTMISDGAIVNADINSSAQITYGKLNLTNTIVAADISATAAIPMSKLALDPTSRANHTGSQTASTISDFDTQVRTSKVTDLTAPTASFSMNSQKITSLGTPTSNTDAATKAYADLMVPLSSVGVANGVAELDADGLVPVHHLPSLSITTTQVVSSQAAMLALTAQTGDVAVRTDVNKTFILTASPASTLGNWQELLTPTDSVLSVDGQTGAVSLSGTYATVANAANKLPLAGGTMSGAIAMGSNKITGLGTPTANGDAVTKAYADSILVGAPGNLTGPITSVGAATSVAAQTGTGSTFVMDTSPTLVTPVLGVASATSINGTTIPTSKTLVATDSTTYVVPSQTGNSGKYLTTNGTTSSWAGAVSTSGGDTITVASGTTVPLTISNLGTGNSFLVEDSTNPDSTPFVIAADGRTLIGHTTAGTVVVNSGLQVSGTAGTSYVSQTRFSADANGPGLLLSKSRGSSYSVPGAVTSADLLGQLSFIGDDGTSYVQGANVYGYVDGTVSTGVVPGRLVLSTASSAGTMTERMRISSAGNVFIGTNTTAGQNTGGLTIQGNDVELMNIMGAY